MKRLTTTLALGLILGFMLLVILPVQAQTTGSSGSNATAWGAENRGPSDRIARMLDSLGEKGYDVSAIMSALESGDTETARTLLHQFLQENQDALPMGPPAGETPIPGISQYGNGNDPRGAENCGPSDRIARMLDSLGEKGYDVSAIRSALESGDTETARTLLHQFLQENQDALPMRPPAGDTPIPGISQYRNGNDPRGAFCQASARNTSISRPLQGTAGGKQARGGMKQTSSRTS